MIVSDRYRIDARTQLPDFASDACAEGMSQRAVAGVATGPMGPAVDKAFILVPCHFLMRTSFDHQQFDAVS